MGSWLSFRLYPSLQRAAFAQPQITSCATGYLGPLWPLGASLYVSTSPPLQLASCSHFRCLLLRSYVSTGSSPSLRLSLRASLRPSLLLSLRVPIRSKGRQIPSQRRLRAWRFADIPTAPPSQNSKAVLVVVLSTFSASLALAACAIASALAPQRFLTASATVIASALTTQRLIGSALRSQRFAVNRSRGWRLA